MCQSLLLIKLQTSVLQLYLRNETLTQVFSSEYCEISKNTFSYRTPPVVASGYLYMVSVNAVTKDLL